MDMAKPKIRFKGYTDEWEQRKLNEVTVKIGSGKTPSGGKSAYVDTGIPLIRSQNVNDDKVDFNDIVYIDELTDESMANSRVFTNDVLLNITGASIGRSAVYKGLDQANVNQHVCIVRPTDGYCPDFVQLNLASDSGQKQIESSQAGGGREGLNFQQIGKMHFSFPTLDEQKQIGGYFNALDNLITLHQRKCEQAKKLKKYMLQKMFPQNGQKVPEIRFKGFTDDWEQRKLGDVIDDMYNGQTPSRNKSEYWNGTIKWLSSGELNRGTVYDSIETITEEGQKAANLKIVPKGTFVMAITGLEAAGTRGNCALLGFDTTLNQSCMALFPKQEMLTSEFLFQWYRKVGEEYGINYTQGTKQQSYNAELIKILPISLPSVVEQRKISSYLSQLDHLITLHQQKCDELKNIKKFMLQNMFI